MPTRRNLPRNQRQLRRKRSFLRRRTRLAHARRGASSWTLRLRSWFLHHRRSLAGSLQDLLTTPLPTLLSCLAIGIAFALPMMLYIALHNLQALGVEQVDVAEISVFLRRDLDEEQGHRLARRIQEWPTAGSVEYRSREQALEEFRAWSGFGDILDDLAENPLSAVLLVRPADARPDTLSLEALRLDLEALPEVELARAELEWVRRLQRALMLAERLVDLLAILLMGGALLAVANSIRLMIAGRHDEIVVTKMVGGTAAFVRRPFLYSGFWYGLGGGIIAWAVTAAGFLWLAGPVRELAQLYGSGFLLQGPTLGNAAFLLGGASLLGLAGSWLAVSRHLDAIEVDFQP